MQNMKRVNFDLEFLGYRFKKIGKNIQVEISQKKINKIKTRIIKSFLSYIKTKNFYILKSRIIFLTTNYYIYKHEDRALKGGLYYNYNLIDNENSLNELDGFLAKLIFSKKGSIGIKNDLTMAQKNELKKYTFTFGFKNKVLKKFTPFEIGKIKRCWK